MIDSPEFSEFAASEGCREPQATGVFRQRIDPYSDEYIVARFNELVERCEAQILGGCDGKTWIDRPDLKFRLRPTPRYRPFTAVEAAGQLGRRINILGAGPFSDWSVQQTRILAGWHIDFEKALKTVTFTDTGEPFGVKE